MFADSGGDGHSSACQTEKKKKKKKAEDMSGVLMLLFYFYKGVYGGDHDEPAVAHCAIISEWNATEILILYVYIGNETFPAISLN